MVRLGRGWPAMPLKALKRAHRVQPWMSGGGMKVLQPVTFKFREHYGRFAVVLWRTGLRSSPVARERGRASRNESRLSVKGANL